MAFARAVRCWGDFTRDSRPRALRRELRAPASLWRRAVLTVGSAVSCAFERAAMAAGEPDASAVDALMTIVHSRPTSPILPALSAPQPLLPPPPPPALSASSLLAAASSSSLAALASLPSLPPSSALSPALSTPSAAGTATAAATAGARPGLLAGPQHAYAKLEGEDFVYYMTTLGVVLGRAAGGPLPLPQVDVVLGTTKIISRQHARIDYNFETRAFELTVLGKNGAYVDNHYYPPGAPPILLESKYAGENALGGQGNAGRGGRTQGAAGGRRGAARKLSLNAARKVKRVVPRSTAFATAFRLSPRPFPAAFFRP